MPDRRHARGVRYALVTILMFVFLGKLSGEDRLTGIAEWVQHRKVELAQALHLKKPCAPHRTTYSRILGRSLDVAEFEQVVREYFASRSPAGCSVLLVLDGKTLRGTIPAGQTQGLQLLAAFLPGEGWVIAQVEVDGKENEIAAAPRVLQVLDLRGKIVTGDAMLAQRDLSVQIVEGGGDYVWTIKDNQPQVCQDIATLFAPEKCVKGFSPAVKKFDTATTVEKGHGRLERRTLTVSGELKGYVTWPYAEQVFKVERHCTRLSLNFAL